jgi:hypothetical protein
MNTVILNWQRPLWEGDEEVVRKSVKHQPMGVAAHICMKKPKESSCIGVLTSN